MANIMPDAKLMRRVDQVGLIHPFPHDHAPAFWLIPAAIECSHMITLTGTSGLHEALA